MLTFDSHPWSSEILVRFAALHLFWVINTVFEDCLLCSSVYGFLDVFYPVFSSSLTLSLGFAAAGTFSCASCGWRVCRGTGRRTCRARGRRAAACERRRSSCCRRARRRTAPASSKDNLSTDRVRGHVSHKPALLEPLLLPHNLLNYFVCSAEQKTK